MSGTPVCTPPPGPSDLPAAFPSLHQAPPLAARAAVRLQQALTRLGAARGERLLLAVSGGADSTALACLAALAAERSGLHFVLAACDHGLRPGSAAECRFVETLGSLLHMPVHVLALHVDKAGPGLEERARHARYAALSLLMQEQRCDWLVTAHHAEDVREDMLLRLLRGTGWPALGGMAAADHERGILRPLLAVEPAVLRQVLYLLGIPYCEDESNQDVRFARNRVRHQILPCLRQEHSGLDRGLTDLAKLAAVDRAFFDEWTGRVLERSTLTAAGTMLRLFLPMEALRSCPGAVRLRLYLAMIQRLARLGARGQARASALYALDGAVEAGQWPRRFQLPGGMTLTLTGKGLQLCAAALQRAGNGAPEAR